MERGTIEHVIARPRGDVLDEGFFALPADVVGAALVGKVLWRPGVGGGRLVEVEAYLGRDDPASHAYRGETARNRAMFGPPGSIYVYLSYGVHVMLNLVCGCEGEASAVLVRALEPLEPVRELRRNRGDLEGRLPTRAVAAGPGRVGKALGLDLSWDGTRLARRFDAEGLVLVDDGVRPPVEVTKRIGISVGADLELRYIHAGSRFVSRPPRRGAPHGGGGEAMDRGLT